MDGELVKNVFFEHGGGGFDDDVDGAAPQGFTEISVECIGGDGVFGGAGDEGGGDFVGDEDFLDEASNGVFAGMTSNSDDFEVFGGLAMDGRSNFGLGFLQFWF